ncbi:hypothetical protein BY996DRAFT_6580688 [Phakopsora pachyrhizi]|nr:hypothetical protein BY996DRAFT_6580688 [Phakopsora pachyrhizi]
MWINLFVITKNKHKVRLPLLTQTNFFVWSIKISSVLRAKKIYQLILRNNSNVQPRDNKGKFVNLSELLKEKWGLDFSIITTHINNSLLCHLAVDGGKEDPVRLWTNKVRFESSNKQANVFRAWMKIKSLQLKDKTSTNSSILSTNAYPSSDFWMWQWMRKTWCMTYFPSSQTHHDWFETQSSIFRITNLIQEHTGHLERDIRKELQ